MITQKQIENITDLTYKECGLDPDSSKWTPVDNLKSNFINDTLTLVMAGTFITLDGLKAIELMRITLNGIELILTENRKSK